MQKEEKSSVSCLNFQITDATGTKKFLDIVASEQFDNKNHCVPVKWPDMVDKQKGPCCAIYTTVTLGKFSELCEAPIPPARKADIVTAELKAEEIVESLRAFAKKNGLTSFGAIFKGEAFNIFAKHLKMQGAELFSMPTTKAEYIKKICNTLELGKAMIISADVLHNFPVTRVGEGAHWALIFGYIYLDKECHFLVFQYGAYFLWNAEALFQSNKKLPLKNCFFGTYIKKEKQYIKINEYTKSSYPPGTKFFKIEEAHLNKFRFTGFAASALPMKNRITNFSSLLKDLTILTSLIDSTRVAAK